MMPTTENTEGTEKDALIGVEKQKPIFEAPLLTYMKLANIQKSLRINFNARRLKDGAKRMGF